MKCFVLTIDDTGKIKGTKLSFSDEELANSSTDFNYNSLGLPIKYFRSTLQESYRYFPPYPIIDETGYKGLGYFQLVADMSDWKATNKALAAYSMRLTLKDREMNVLVVRKRDFNRSKSPDSNPMNAP